MISLLISERRRLLWLHDPILNCPPDGLHPFLDLRVIVELSFADFPTELEQLESALGVRRFIPIRVGESGEDAIPTLHLIQCELRGQAQLLACNTQAS